MDLPPMLDYLAALETEYSQYYELSTPGTRAYSKYAHLARSLLAQYVAAYPGFNWCSLMPVVDTLYADIDEQRMQDHMLTIEEIDVAYVVWRALRGEDLYGDSHGIMDPQYPFVVIKCDVIRGIPPRESLIPERTLHMFFNRLASDGHADGASDDDGVSDEDAAVGYTDSSAR